MTKITSFEADIRPLFTDRDIQGMIKAFNLASYDDVKAHASAIYDRIRGIGGAVMPPPPPRGEGPWPQSRIDLFAKWLADGCKQVTDAIRDRDVVLTFEPEPGMFVDTMQKFEELAARVKREDVFRFTIDVGHA